MTNFIPIFPLQVVVFPDENLNLHVFEPRYKQLVLECFEQKKPFGIPTVIDNELKDYGSLVYIQEITATYSNGEMDIKTKGDKVFRVLEVIKDIPDKLYSGAIVNYPHNDPIGDSKVMEQLVDKMKRLHESLQVTKNFRKSEAEINAYDIAHHVGLTLHQEYELLQLTMERQRQEYLKRHFDATMPTFDELNRLKEKILLNGHFKNLSGWNLK